MLRDIVCLSWFDLSTVIVTFVSLVLVQIFNAYYANTTTTTKSDSAITTTTKTNNISSSTPTPTTTPITTTAPLQKQKSAQHEDASAISPSSPSSSPSSSARNSIGSLHNGCIPHVSSSDALSDEYHEDEDTLSLENLFPCDQSEIYASKKISFIIEELMQTEANYVKNMRKGLENYGGIAERQDLPEELRGVEKRNELLGNIEEIIALHERQILPMMQRNQRDLKQLFDEFAGYFEKNHFYCYVIFTMNKKSSMQLRQDHREWFTELQSELNDKLGIDSFLVQPIQRLTRYPLLLQQFISEFYKSGISCKPVLMSVCKLETRMRRLLEVVNQAEEVLAIDEINEFNILAQGNFCKSTEFDAYHHRSRKKYRAKVFLFDRCLICTEVRKKRLAYRCHYAWESIELNLHSSKCIALATRLPGTATSRPASPAPTPTSTASSTPSVEVAPSELQLRVELELTALEACVVTQWMRCARKINAQARIEAAQHGKFTLPMDLVLGVAFAIWLIWRYLY